MSRNKFVIAPHMRLHEWVAEEKGYFGDEGLEYEFADPLKSEDGKVHDLGNRVGAFQRGRTSVSLCLQNNYGHISGVIGG